MKLILDLDQQTLENMQGYCDHHDISVNKLVSDLFNHYIQDPANVIDELAANSELNKLNEFTTLLTKYLNDAILDIEESAKSDEAYDTDLSMAKVFKALNRDYIDRADVLTGLFKAYQEGD